MEVMHKESGLTGQMLMDLEEAKTVVNGHTIEYNEQGLRHAIIWKNRLNETHGRDAATSMFILGLGIKSDGPASEGAADRRREERYETRGEDLQEMKTANKEMVNTIRLLQIKIDKLEKEKGK